MSQRIRYQAQTVLAERPGVTTYSGLDPVTGLPVLIYRFSGPLNPALARLDSAFLPRLLAWREEDEGGLVVVAWSSAYVPAAGQALDNARLLDSAQALADAEAAGVSHGDLRPERFMLAGDSILIEGFGVPWQQAAEVNDVVNWARSVRALGHEGNAAITGLLDSIESGSPVTARQLVDRLRDLLLRSVPAPLPAQTAADSPQTEEGGSATETPAAADAEPLTLSWDEPASLADQRQAFAGSASQLSEVEELELEFGPADGIDTPHLSEAVETEAQPAAGSRLTDEPDADDDASAQFVPSETFASERLVGAAADPPPREGQPAGVPAAALPAGGGARFVGQTGQRDRPGSPAAPASSRLEPATDLPSTERSNYRAIMFSSLLVLSAVLIVLLLLARRDGTDSVPATATQAMTYVINVQVEPADLPPVNLYVLESPAASQFSAGDGLGTAPRRIALDAEGTWVFEGRFQGRVSDPVSIAIPEDRASAVTITIPPAATED